MGLTVYAENMGFFHKGSGGKGVAPGDVCLTPPPPPAGPLPVPYVNMLSAGDLTKGSKTVKIDGEPTALESDSEVSTSTGDEPGTQGGNVVTHKTKGKGFFQSWSFTVKVEGKGVCVHGGLMGQNSGSMPAGCMDPTAMTSFTATLANTGPCHRHYRRRSYGPTPDQTAFILGKPCWVVENGVQCGKPGATADHQPPLLFAWYAGGCHMGHTGFRAWATAASDDTVKPQCAGHSSNNVQKGTSWITRPKGKLTVAQVMANITKYLT